MPARKKSAPETTNESDEEERARRDRILDVAIRLAEEGGFENVRQRDVAEQAGVALGTLYKSFRGKEDLLSAALGRETEVLERRLDKRPPSGASSLSRVTEFFEMLTRTLCKKPNYARAIIKAMASGEPEATANIVAYQAQIYRMIITAMRGPDHPHADAAPTEDELAVALLLQQIWFAALVGWSAKLHGIPRVIEQVGVAARLLLAALAVEQRARVS
ncbi:MAG: TetR/AcrR family transcriptional regulator [Deltaproteobacteria bacterium]|nr:TetR/AcrR family transcriptional regulator [Deltaproteobacteria bacterium]